MGLLRRPLFERTRSLFAILASWLVPTAGRRRPVIVLEGPRDSAPDELVTVRRISGGQVREELIDVQTWVRESVPSFNSGFKAAWWLWNGHLQTIYSVFASFEHIDPISYTRTTLRDKDGGSIGIDFVHADYEHFHRSDSPLLIVTHGLTGGSHESYVRNVLCDVIRPKSQGGLGVRAAVVNFRGCAGVPVTSSAQLYSAGNTEDLRLAVKFIRSLNPQSELLGLGFSLGASVLTRYVGEEGDNCTLTAVSVVGTPFDAVEMTKKMESTLFIREAYSKGMASNLSRLLALNSVDPDSPLNRADGRLHPQRASIASLKSGWTRPLLRDFDSAVTRVIGGPEPPFPFATAWDYYAWASAQNRLPGVRVPLLAINASDDPIIACEALPFDTFKASTRAVLAIVGGGGHLGWFEGGSPLFRAPSRWVHRPISEFFKAALEELVLSKGRLADQKGGSAAGDQAAWSAVEEEGRPFRWEKRQRIFI